MSKDYITIYKDKNGEWDFGVSTMVGELDFPEIKKMRSIIITEIGRASCRERV